MQQAELSSNGYLARWEIVGAESGCMVGDPAVSVFAEAYLNGIRGYDVEKSLSIVPTKPLKMKIAAIGEITKNWVLCRAAFQKLWKMLILIIVRAALRRH